MGWCVPQERSDIDLESHGWPGWRSGLEPVEEVAGWAAEPLATDSG